MCVVPFSEVTILFNQHFHYCREYRGKIPDGHSKPIYFVLKPLNLQNSWRIFDRPTANKKMTLKDRITPHVTNFFRLRLSIEKQEGKRKYKSDGAVMVGEFVCMYVCSCTVSEWECEWVMWVWCVWVRDVRVSEVKWSPYRIVNMQNMQVFARKHAHDQPKNHDQ